MIKAAWTSVTYEAICKCFKKVGMRSDEPHDGDIGSVLEEPFGMEIDEEQVIIKQQSKADINCIFHIKDFHLFSLFPQFCLYYSKFTIQQRILLGECLTYFGFCQSVAVCR